MRVVQFGRQTNQADRTAILEVVGNRCDPARVVVDRLGVIDDHQCSVTSTTGCAASAWNSFTLLSTA